MSRDKFVTRPILLRTEQQRNTALALINNLPLDYDEPIEVVVREPIKSRGLDANGYYWLRLGEIAAQAWFNGKQFNSDIWHHYSRHKLMPEQITTKDGTVRSKWLEAPDGSLTVISTTQLERRCFAEYTLIVEVFGAELGVQYSANPRERCVA